jgi:hypothetical protein
MRPPRWLIVLRWLSLPYFVAIAFLAMGSVVVAGYGLAHASEDAAAQFLLTVLLGAIALLLPAAFIWSNSRSLWVRSPQVIAACLMMAGFGLAAKMFSYLVVEPKLWAWRFDRHTHGIEASLIKEQPMLQDGLPIGLETTVDIVLPRDVPLGRDGYAIYELLRGSSIAIEGGGGSVFSHLNGDDDVVTFSGKPIEALPAIRALHLGDSLRFSSAGNDPTYGELPRGTYRVTRKHYFHGLEHYSGTLALDEKGVAVPPTRTLCKRGFSAEHQKAIQTQMIESEGKPMSLVLSTRINLGDRRGYRGFSRSVPLRFRYDHARWQQDVQHLSTPSCESLEARTQAIEEQARKHQEAVAYTTGQIKEIDNPLYREACAGDVAAVRRRYGSEKDAQGRWQPAFDMAGIVLYCSVEKHNTELFALLMPALIERNRAGFETDAYCKVLRALHQTRDVALLTQVHALGGDLVCANSVDWMLGALPNGFNRSDGTGIQADHGGRPDTVAWMTLLKNSGVDFCHHAPGTEPMLSVAARWWSPEAIVFLLKAGCDDFAAIPDEAGANFDVRNRRISPSLWWALRRWSPGAIEAGYGELDRQAIPEPLLDEISKRMPLQASELNHVIDSASGETILHRIPVSDALIVPLVRAGARLDLVSSRGNHWLGLNYSDIQLRPEILEVLNSLTDSELKQFTATITHSGQPMPLRALKPPSPGNDPNNFRELLCRRRIIDCETAITVSR